MYRGLVSLGELRILVKFDSYCCALTLQSMTLPFINVPATQKDNQETTVT